MLRKPSRNSPTTLSAQRLDERCSVGRAGGDPNAGVRGASGDQIARRNRYHSVAGRITAPTLVIVGKMDTVTPVAESRALSEGIPNSTLVVIEKAGHFSMLERPVEFNRVLRGFLDQHVQSSLS
jgi:pimeloyl-ACP methyl ester carboxylesterase